MSKEYNVAVGKGKICDARKKQPASAKGGKREDTLMNYKGKKAKAGYLDPRKKNAKPAPGGKSENKMI
jgi:hypothetical protein